MAKTFLVTNSRNQHFGNALEYIAPMMEGGKALGVILKIDEENSHAFYYHEAKEVIQQCKVNCDQSDYYKGGKCDKAGCYEGEELTTVPKITPSAYHQWEKDGIDFGSFATSLFRTYQIADAKNKKSLETAFPDYLQ